MINATLDRQANVVLEHLMSAGSITNVEANIVLKVRSVSRRITDIGKQYPIRKEHKVDSTGQRYVRYYLDRFLPVPVKPAADTWPPLVGQLVHAQAHINLRHDGTYRQGTVLDIPRKGDYYLVDFAGGNPDGLYAVCRKLEEMKPING